MSLPIAKRPQRALTGLFLMLGLLSFVACGDARTPGEAKPSPGATVDGGDAGKPSLGATPEGGSAANASLTATLGGTGALRPSSPASMVLISIDTLRSDHVGAYGGEVATPHVDALAASGVLFERAYSHVPMTLPSHLSLLTGLLPPRHGVRDNIGYRAATETLPYVPERLRAAGYATAAAVSAYVLRGDGGLSLGFDLYDDALASPLGAGPGAGPVTDLGRRGVGGVQRPGRRTLEAVRPWLARQGTERPFFLFVHLFEPHTPYEPPAPFRQTYGETSYAGEVAAADALVGELVAELRGLGLYDETAIVVLSDHGEGLGDHGEDEHGLLLYRESLQVPLILKLPSAAATTTGVGRRVAQPVGLVDVAPTLLRLAALTPDAELDGVSLLDIMVGRDRGPVYGETFYPRLHFGWSELTSVVAGPHHFIQGPEAELYDLVQDPAERQDLLPTERRLAATLRDHLAERVRDPLPPGSISEQDRQALAALGYVGRQAAESDVDGPGDGAPRAHPKDQLATVQELKTCLRLYQEGKLAAAEASCRRATQLHPQALDAWEHLARALLEQGRRQDALVALERSLLLAEGRASHLAVAAASLLLEARRPAAALELLQREIVMAPDAWSLRLYEARTLASTGQVGLALERAQTLLAERPEDADAIYLRGALRIGTGDLAGAEADLRRALEMAPSHTAALSDLATLLAHGGRHQQAADLYRRLLQLRPGDPAAVEGLRRSSADGGDR